jgi:hypothetical protein
MHWILRGGAFRFAKKKSVSKLNLALKTQKQAKKSV